MISKAQFKTRTHPYPIRTKAKSRITRIDRRLAKRPDLPFKYTFVKRALDQKRIIARFSHFKPKAPLVLFVEDVQAAFFTREILRSHPKGLPLLAHLHFAMVNGRNAVMFLAEHIDQNPFAYPSIPILDGDAYTKGMTLPNCVLVLPGHQAPERVVLEALKNSKKTGLATKFEVPKKIIEDAFSIIVNRRYYWNPRIAHHGWPGYFATRVNQERRSKDCFSSITSWELLVREYCEKSLSDDKRDEFFNAISNLLNPKKDKTN